MVAKCKKGYKKVGKTCVTNKDYKKFGKFADEFQILKLALIGAVTSVGGWAIFQGIVNMTRLDRIPAWLMIVLGAVIIMLTYKFGLKKDKDD